MTLSISNDPLWMKKTKSIFFLCLTRLLRYYIFVNQFFMLNTKVKRKTNQKTKIKAKTCLLQVQLLMDCSLINHAHDMLFGIT